VSTDIGDGQQTSIVDELLQPPLVAPALTHRRLRRDPELHSTPSDRKESLDARLGDPPSLEARFSIDHLHADATPTPPRRSRADIGIGVEPSTDRGGRDPESRDLLVEVGSMPRQRLRYGQGRAFMTSTSTQRGHSRPVAHPMTHRGTAGRFSELERFGVTREPKGASDRSFAPAGPSGCRQSLNPERLSVWLLATVETLPGSWGVVVMTTRRVKKGPGRRPQSAKH
jgi:hypothetical protein